MEFINIIMYEVRAVQPRDNPSNRVRDNKTSRRQVDRHFCDGGANIRPVSVRAVCGAIALLVCEFHRGSGFQRDWLTVAIALCDYPDDYLIAVSYVLYWIVVVMEMAQGDCAGGAGGGLLKHQLVLYVRDSDYFGGFL